MKFYTIVLTKKDESDKAGVSLTEKPGGLLVISKITPGGLFEQCAGHYGKVGMRVLRIGSVALDGMGPSEAVGLIKDAGAGTDLRFLLVEGSDSELQSVSASKVQAITTHKTPDGKVKVAFTGKPGYVKVTKINEGSPFENTALKVGDTLLSVNNISLSSMAVDQIRDIIGQASDPITLIAGQVSPKSAPSASAGGSGNLPEGGDWGIVKYVGPQTQQMACLGCLCCGPLACCILACPSDEMDAYRHNGVLYDASGHRLAESPSNFTPTKSTMRR